MAVVAGSVAQRPGNGGHTWVFLQYLLGFRKLGWDVVFLDRLEADMRVGRDAGNAPLEDSPNVRYFRDIMTRFGFDGCYALLCDGGTHTIASANGIRRLHTNVFFSALERRHEDAWRVRIRRTASSW